MPSILCVYDRNYHVIRRIDVYATGLVCTGRGNTRVLTVSVRQARVAAEYFFLLY